MLTRVEEELKDVMDYYEFDRDEEVMIFTLLNGNEQLQLQLLEYIEDEELIKFLKYIHTSIFMWAFEHKQIDVELDEDDPLKEYQNIDES